MMYPKKLFLVVLLLCSLSGFSQVSVQFIPEIYEKGIDGLMHATIFNGAAKRSVRLNITVTEEKAGKVVTVQTPPFLLIPGNNVIPSSAIRGAKVSISANNTGNYIRKNQYFPQGSYAYNFVVMASSSSEEIIVDQDFNHDVVPPAPMDLIEPYNQDQICEKRPMLSWQPSIPQMPGMLYELLLVEIKEKQNAVEAINYNLPVINQRGIVANLLMYPPVSKDLAEGKKYAWQVTAYKDQTVINRSEVWEFKIDCKDSIANVHEDDYGYRDIEDLVKGNYYVAEGLVKFAVVNSYNEQNLKYEVSCITDPGLKIRSLPKIKLKKGQNKIKLDFSHNFSFKNDYSYILKARLPNGTTKSLRFIYKELE